MVSVSCDDIDNALANLHTDCFRAVSLSALFCAFEGCSCVISKKIDQRVLRFEYGLCQSIDGMYGTTRSNASRELAIFALCY